MGVRGSHHKYAHKGVGQRLVLTRHRSGKAKPYQIRQLRNLAVSYGLRAEGEDQ
jgi:predicted RNA binding protein YcfA (HicA-like mRNA interferase family)